MLRLLVASGADPHAVSEHGFNAFHAAIDVNGTASGEESVRDTFGYLKELGVDIEHRDHRNQTPLARSILLHNELDVKVLCELGADPNAVCPKHACRDGACARIDMPLLFHAADGPGVRNDLKTDALLRAGADPFAKDPEGFTPLQRVVASVCRDAADYEGAYYAFFRGLGELRFEGRPVPASRNEFIAAATPLIQTYVEQFACKIPVKVTFEYSHLCRKENLACIVSLCAYEAWARHEQRRSSAS